MTRRIHRYGDVMQPNGFTPPQADYERPKPKAKATQSGSPFSAVVMATGEIIRLSVIKSDDKASAALQHDYPEIDFVGKEFDFGGEHYEVTEQDGRVLTIEAI